VLVTETLRRARVDSSETARLNSPGLLWWRAQLRRRNAAVERIGKPVLRAQFFALSLYVGAVVALVASQARHGMQWLTWLAELTQSRTFHLEVLWPAMATRPDWNSALVAPGVALLVLFSGVILYFATDRQ